MLDSFRKASQSWFIKILFGLLILSFGVWGIGDVVRDRAELKPAITVGKQAISAAEVAEEFRRDTKKLSSMFGGKLTREQARQFGLLQRTIEQIVNRALVDQAADDLGLGVDDDSLRRIIADTPAFQNELHVFDKTVYQHVLARAGFTERQFVAMEKSDMAREQVGQMIGGGLQAPALMADALFRYRQENRVAEIVTFPTDKMPAPAKPDDAVLSQYHQAHAALFMSPELRGISALIVRTADVASDIKISDADVEKSFQIRQAEFQTPETRNIQQVLFDDAAKAKAFAETVKQDKDFAAAAKGAGLTVSDLGWVDRKGLPLPALADAAFADAGAGIVGPIETPLGWHVLRVAQVVPGKGRQLSDVKSQIVQDLVKDEATNRLYALSTKIEDSIGSGAGIDETASALNLKPLKVAAIDERGNGPDGKPAPGVPLVPGFLAKAFQTTQGSTTEVTQLDDNSGYFVLRVESVSPPALKAFDLVKDQVLAAWTQEQREQASRRQAEAAAERLKKGEPMSAIAGPYKVETTKPFLRASGDGKASVPPLLAAEMFKQTQIGGVAVVAAQGGTIVARLTTIIAADPKAQPDQFAKAREQLSQASTNDVMQQYLAALQKEKSVTVNSAAIEAQFPK
jgi:peptidyl-prolyl cis-trans isomerase D